MKRIQLRRYGSKLIYILTDVGNDLHNVVVAGIVKTRKRPASLERGGKLRHISSKDIAGRDEACTFDGNRRGKSRECESSDEGDGTEEEHFFKRRRNMDWYLEYERRIRLRLSNEEKKKKVGGQFKYPSGGLE